MKNKLILAALVLSTVLVQNVFAAETVELNIEEAINKAFATNADVKIAGYDFDAARAELNAARMERGVTISGSHSTRRGGYKHDQYIGGIYTKKLGTTHSNSLTASIPVYTGGALSGNVIVKKANYQQALAGKQKAYNDMHYTVTEAYYNCLLTQDLERVAQESVKTLTQHLQHVKDSFEVGVVAKVDVLRSEVELADAEQGLIKAENARKVAMHNLNKIIGLPLDTDLKLTDTLKQEPYKYDLEYCLDFAAANRPELEQAKQGFRAAKGGVRAARSGFMPQISVNASKSWSNFDVETNTTHGWPGNKDEEWGVGATANWNIFDCGVTLSKVHAAEAKARAAKEKWRDTEDGVMLDVRNLYYGLAESEKRIRTTEMTVAKAQEDYDIAKLRYENGVGTNTDVLDAQVALTQAKTNYIEACYDYSTGKIALDNAIGIPFQSPLEKKPVVEVKKTKKEKAAMQAEKEALKAQKKAAKAERKAKKLEKESQELQKKQQEIESTAKDIEEEVTPEIKENIEEE